jgi:hypothetical protein
MKKLLLLSALLMYSCSPTLVKFSEDEKFIEIVDVPGPKNELFLKANNWMIETFNSAESVIQHSDKEEGVIIGKYLMYGGVSPGIYGTTVDTRVYAIIDIRVKDDRVRLEVKPQDWYYDSSGMTVYQFSKQDAVAAINRLSDSFYKGISKETIEF